MISQQMNINTKIEMIKKKKKNQMEILQLKKEMDVLERSEIVEELMTLKTLI